MFTAAIDSFNRRSVMRVKYTKNQPSKRPIPEESSVMGLFRAPCSTGSYVHRYFKAKTHINGGWGFPFHDNSPSGLNGAGWHLGTNSLHGKNVLPITEPMKNKMYSLGCWSKISLTCTHNEYRGAIKGKTKIHKMVLQTLASNDSRLGETVSQSWFSLMLKLFLQTATSATLF